MLRINNGAIDAPGKINIFLNKKKKKKYFLNDIFFCLVYWSKNIS